MLTTESPAENAILTTLFSPDCTLLAAASSRYIYIQNIEKQNRWEVQSEACINTITFRPDGKALAFSTFDGPESKWNHKIWLLDLRTQERSHKLGYSYFVRALAFSPACTLLASGSDDGTVRLWETTTYNSSTQLLGQTEPVNATSKSPVNVIDFSPTGKKIAAGSDDGKIRVWNTISGELLFTLGEHKDSIESIAFSTKSQVLASGSQNGTVRTWNLVSGKTLSAYQMEGSKCLFSSIAVSTTTVLACATDDECDTRNPLPFTRLPG